MDKEKVA